MFDFIQFLNTDNGEKITDGISIKSMPVKGASLLSVRADVCASGLSIDADLGIETEMRTDSQIESFMADYRYSEFWCRPSFGGSDLSAIPDETQYLVLKLKDGRFVVLLPLVNREYKSVIKGGDGCIVLKTFSWCKGLTSCNGEVLVYAVGDDPYELTEKCVSVAIETLSYDTKLIFERKYPDVFEYLGWCTWDSMQIRVSEEGILNKCREFADKSIPVKWLIIDDMWAEIRDFYGKEYSSFGEMCKMMHSSRMYDFLADPIRFPNGLKGCIDKIKSFGISVGVWHPTTGYWAGFDPDGDGYKKLKHTLMLTDSGRYMPDWHRESSYEYYKTLHSEFKACGADFVKIDNQSMIRRYYKYCAPVGEIAQQFHDAMEDSAKENFGAGIINCMGMASEDMFKRRESPVCRCSNDFLPENREWFTSHVLQCAYNSLILGQLYWCDWDMWWSDDSQARKNSLMRAISGGPIYVSDKIDRSRKEIFSPLATDDGRILRCDRPCMPTADCITDDPTVSRKALKLQNIAGDCGVMAILDLDAENRPVKATVSPSMIKGLTAHEYAVYEHFSGSLRMMHLDDSFELELSGPDDVRLYIFAPVNNGFAVIGRTDKFISPKTVRSINGREVTLIENGRYAYVVDGRLYTEQK